MKYETDKICPLTGVDVSQLRSQIVTQLGHFKYLVHEELQKEDIRKLHADHLADFYKANFKFWNSSKYLVEKMMINGADLVPDKIEPVLLEVTSKDLDRGRIFRLAKFNWSVPPSNGFGRRLRFLVWDNYHNSLIGVIGLTDPVFNLKVRDEFINWSTDDRKQRLVSVLDAFMLGAVPPYSKILGGKLVATLLNSKDISEIFEKKYKKRKGVISKTSKNPKLAAITTTSVLGRSSVYNRMKLDGQTLMSNIGYTSGFGHFQFTQDIFEKLKLIVMANDEDNKASFVFGKGPNWKIRVIREGLRLLGLKQAHVKHGIKRGVYYCRHFNNSEAYLNGQATHLLQSTTKSTAILSAQALNRWVIPRSIRDESYKEFRVDDWFKDIEHKLEGLNEAR
jgi:hypothetical protein